MLFGFRQVKPQVDVLAAHNCYMLVFDELDIAGTHKPVHHEANKPVQVCVDTPILFKDVVAAAIFFWRTRLALAARLSAVQGALGRDIQLTRNYPLACQLL